MTPSRTDSRGFTLVELIISLGVSAIVIASAMAMMVGQQRAFRHGTDDRTLQELARVALGRMSADLRAVGYGVDPALAFDFGPVPEEKVRMKAGPDGTYFKAASFRCAAGPACRDRTDGSDEIVFLSRDPLFAKPLRAPVNADSDTLRIAGPLKAPLVAGQILQVVCYTGTMTWAYVSVAAEVPATDALTVDVPIVASSTYDFPTQNQSLASACFQMHMTQDPPYTLGDTAFESAARVFKIDRYRYFVRQYDGRPFLMLDRGGPDDAPVLEVIAPDVEDLQFSYLFPNAAADPLVGATVGTVLENGPAGIELTPETGFPAYGDSLQEVGGPQRNHQAGNIRAVRISIVVRTPLQNLADPTTSDVIPAAGNRGQMTGAPGYRRLKVETTVVPPNMAARSPFYPMYGVVGTYLNVGGG